MRHSSQTLWLHLGKILGVLLAEKAASQRGQEGVCTMDARSEVIEDGYRSNISNKTSILLKGDLGQTDEVPPPGHPHLLVVLLEDPFDRVHEVVGFGLPKGFVLDDAWFSLVFDLLVNDLAEHVAFMLLPLGFELAVDLVEDVESGTTTFGSDVLAAFKGGLPCQFSQSLLDFTGWGYRFLFRL